MRRNVIVRTMERTTPGVIDDLAAAGVATVHEAMGRTGLLGTDLSPIQAGVRIAGSAVTVSSQPGDNLMLHAAVEVVQPGDVLVVTTTSPSTDGMFGELLATSLQQRGCRGLVIDAGVRDVADLDELGFPVWERAVSAQGTVKATPCSVNVPVVCAGGRVHPGDVVVAADDGVVIVPRRDAPAARNAARQRLEKESRTRQQLAAGELGIDLYGLRSRPAELGVVYVDRAEDLR